MLSLYNETLNHAKISAFNSMRFLTHKTRHLYCLLVYGRLRATCPGRRVFNSTLLVLTYRIGRIKFLYAFDILERKHFGVNQEQTDDQEIVVLWTQ